MARTTLIESPEWVSRLKNNGSIHLEGVGHRHKRKERFQGGQTIDAQKAETHEKKRHGEWPEPQRDGQ